MSADDRPDESPETEPSRTDRRRLLATASTLAMAGGLAASYGTFGLVAGRFLYPARPLRRRWQFVCETARLAVGGSLVYRAPNGETVNVTRRGAGGDARDYIALSSVCPHLGCQVFWEPQNDRYFCPCHNGTFDTEGTATGGPPADAGQTLSRYPLRVDDDMLFIEVAVEGVTADAGVLEPSDEPRGPGHDPCLGCPGRREEEEA